MKDVNLKRGFMGTALFQKIVDELGEFPTKIKKIKIGNHGEPTLHPDLAECIEYATKSEVADVVELFTNGSKLNPLLNSKIVESGLQRINISLEGLNDERQASNRRKPGFQRYCSWSRRSLSPKNMAESN